MGKSTFCPTCGMFTPYGLDKREDLLAHTCPPIWIARQVEDDRVAPLENEDDEPYYAREIRAWDAEGAAIKRRELDASDYEKSDTIRIMVKSETGEVSFFNVSRELTYKYTADEVKP